MRRPPGTGSIYKPTFRGVSGEVRSSRLYWIAYRVGGQLVREPAKTANRADAEAILRQRLAGLDRGEAPAVARVTWDDLANMIRTDYRLNGRRSTRRLEISLRHIAQTFGGDRASTITTDRLTGYAQRRLDEDGAARATVNRELAAMKRAFRLGHRNGFLPIVPFVPMMKESNARTGFFERADFDRLVKHLPADLRTLVLTAYITGWRVPSEILTRDWYHVDFRAGWLRLEPGETKSGEGRMFPLTPELRRALRAQQRLTHALERRIQRSIPRVFHHEGDPLVYPAKTGGWLVSPYLRRSWVEACRAAGLPGRILHDFRRTATRDLLRAGVSEHVVMAALGWKTHAMLLRYAIVAGSDLLDAAKKRAKLR